MILYKGFLTLRKNGKKEIIEKPNAVAFLFVDMALGVVLLISQQRDAMIRRSNPNGTIIEVAAGTRDLKTSIKELVVKEAREETGERITIDQVKLVNHGVPLATSPGFLTERLWLACVETDLRSFPKFTSRIYGLKAHNERIRRVVVSFDELEKMKFADLKTFGLAQWFLKELLRKERIQS
jgi:8-oxo-dGTP pyrophosphatase MutT (NUDIX family)